MFDTVASSTSNHDTITDFKAGEDKLLLDSNIFASLNFAVFGQGNIVSGSGATALDADDFLVYDSHNGKLYYDTDGSGAGAQVEIVALAGIPALTAADFMEI